MAVHYNNSSSAVAAGSATISWSHKCQGTNRYLLVSFGADANGLSVVAVTYNSVAMSLVSSIVTSNNRNIWVYGLVAPASGTNTVAVELDGTSDLVASAVSFVDVHQSSPTGTAGQDGGTASAASNSVSSATDEIVVDFVSSFGTITHTVDASQTELINRNQSAHRHSVSTEAGASSVSMDWTFSGSSKYCHISVPVKPASLDQDTLAFAYADADPGDGSNTDTLTVPATMSGLNRVLLVAVHWVGTRTVTGVTYGGTAMTSVTSKASPSSPIQNVHVFKLTNPEPGRNDIVVTMSGVSTNNALGWMQFTGAHQTNPTDDVDSVSEASGTPPDNLSSSLTLTSNTEQICADFITLGNNTPTVGAGQTLRYSDTTDAKLFGSTQAGAASVEMSWSWGTDDDYSHVAVGVIKRSGGMSIYHF